MKAYVLVQTDTQRRPVAELLRTLPGVVYAEDVSGPYDALALARSGPDGVGFDGVLDEIRALPGVIHALAAPLSGPAELTEPAEPAMLATSDAA
jgi:AsnC-like helix-turn-helix protein